MSRMSGRWHHFGWFLLASLLADVFLAAWIIGPLSESRIRRVGVLLQLIGVLTVWSGIEQTRELFGLPTLRLRMTEVLGHLKRTARTIVSASLRALGLGTQHTARVAETMSASSEAVVGATAVLGEASIVSTTLDERVAQVEQALLKLKIEMPMIVEGLVKPRFDAAQEQASSEAKVRQAQVSEVRELVTLAQTGGLQLSSFGVFCLLLGTFLGGMPEEVRWIYPQLLP